MALGSMAGYAECVRELAEQAKEAGIEFSFMWPPLLAPAAPPPVWCCTSPVSPAG